MEYARIKEEEVAMDLTRKGKWQYTVANIEALPEEIRAELEHQDILMGLSFPMELYVQQNNDYIRKLALYQEAGVREYWIVDPKPRQVTIYDLEHRDMPVQFLFFRAD